MRHEELELMQRIDTPRLHLRPMRRDDAELVVAWRSEPRTAAMFFSPPPTLEQHLAWFDSPREGRVDYVVVENDTGRPVGTVSFKDVDMEARAAESGTLIGDVGSRGKGYGLEAKVAWSLYGFAVLGLDRIDVTVRRDNEPMLRIEAALGYETVEEVELANALGEPTPYLRMSLPARRAIELEVFGRHDRHGFVERVARRLAAA